MIVVLILGALMLPFVVYQFYLLIWAVRHRDDIDAEVIAHANDEDAWEPPIRVACAHYRPDHNGECLNCDEPYDEHVGHRA